MMSDKQWLLTVTTFLRAVAIDMDVVLEQRFSQHLHKDASQPFKWKHAIGEIILWLVIWYSRYALSYRDLKEIAVERGFKLDHSTIYR